MDAGQAVYALRLFNEKADKLERLSFTRRIFSEPSGVKLQWRQGAEFKTELVGPDEESREAMLLTLRFFVQDNEPSSFRRTEEAYGGLPIDPSLAAEFRDIRRQVTDLLDSATWIQVNEGAITYREIFEVFMWGHHAHANEEKKAKFEKWSRITPLLALLENDFIRTIAALLKAILIPRDINMRALKELGSPAESGAAADPPR